MPDIRLPNGWKCRPSQDACWLYLSRGGKRAVRIVHRREGKDELGLNWTAVSAHRRIGTHWHLLPEAAQARKAIWNAVNEFTGVRRIDQAFPKPLRANVNDNEMFMRFHVGSTWQVVGSDNFQSLIGSPPIGLVMSEFAYANPIAWQKLSPILVANGGWALFITTPFGRNHAHGLYEYAKAQMEAGNDWFAELLTVDDTDSLVFGRLEIARLSGQPYVWQGRKIETIEQLTKADRIAITREIVTAEETQLAAQRGFQEAHAITQQEYYCSFQAAIPGAYFGQVLEEMERAGRVTTVPHDPGFLVETWWDLGIRDDTAIWFVQKVGREYRIIDYYESSGVGIDHYASVLKGLCRDVDEPDNERRKRYRYADVAAVLPHDASHAQLSQRGGASLAQVLSRDYEIRNRIVPQTNSLQWSIQQVRTFLPTCVFDRDSCADGLNKLRMYRRVWDEKTRAYRDTPLHDFCSHAADAFRTGVEGANVNAPPAGQGGHGGLDSRRPPRRASVAISDDPLGD